jgi:hypothetical protein
VSDDETEKLELFTHSEAARESVKHVQKVAQLTGAGRAAGRPKDRTEISEAV